MQERIKKIWDAKLDVTEKVKGENGLPRIIRLSRRLKLSEKETLVMIYTLTCQVAESRGATGGMRYSVMYQGFPKHTKSCSHFLKILLTSADLKSRLYSGAPL